VKRNYAFFIYLLLGFILFAGNTTQKQKKSEFLGKTLFYPFVSSLNRIEEIFEVDLHNKRLLEKVSSQTIKLNSLQNALETAELKTKDTDYKIADIIGYTGDFQQRNLILNTGIRDSIEVDYPVISSNGIVGKIILSSGNYSVLLPFSHSSFQLGIMLKHNKLQGLMKSNALGNSFMTLIKNGSEISIGDTVVTSNISRIFPKGFPVGTISKIIKSTDKVHMKAQIKPFTDPLNVDKVIILKYKKDTNYEIELDKS
jgi:rod shape-determining protein MreC